MLAAKSAIAQPHDALQTWLEAHVSPTRSTEARDEDFRDLEPLGDAIGAAHVVQLESPAMARVPVSPPRRGL